MRKLLFAALVIAALLFTGCATRLVDFTVISTKNFEYAKGQTFRRGAERITGEDAAYMIFIIPTGTPNIKEAIDKALESVNGAVALVDGVLYSKNIGIPGIFFKTSYLVEGTPLIDPALTSTQLEPGYYLAKLNSATDKYELVPVNEAEYEAVKSGYAKD